MSDRQIEKLVALVQAGELAMKLWRAEETAANARTAYHNRIRQFERAHGDERIRMSPGDPKSAAIRAYTQDRYKAALAAKKRAYTAKQKLLRECVKIARLSARGKATEVGHG